MEYDFAVVGGGPAGCFAAIEAAKKGDTVIFEEHRSQPVHCAGLISTSGFSTLGIRKGDFVLNEVKGARLYSPLGTSVEVKASKVKAYAVDRSMFDAHLLEKALSSGAVLESSRVNRIDGSTLAARKKFRAERIVLASGTDYNLQKSLRLNYPREFLVGAQYEMKLDCALDMVELHFLVPDFFAWVIPLGGRARIGLCTKSNPVPYLDSFIRKLKRENRIKGSRIYDKSYGIIPVYNPNLKTEFENINIVGDAAGHVKATTGGGVVMGCIAAKFSASDNYERLWRNAVGSDLRLHLWIHRFVHKLSSKNLDSLFKIVSENNSSLVQYGDMDYASKTVNGLIRNPAFMMKFLLHSPSFLLDLI